MHNLLATTALETYLNLDACDFIRGNWGYMVAAAAMLS